MGVGSGLLKRGEHFLQIQRVPSYHCFVHKDNELGKRFYLRHGFQHVPGSDRANEWYMEKGILKQVQRRTRSASAKVTRLAVR
jgi:ribosomal protein S18 acetylase RimI-like enzyme